MRRANMMRAHVVRLQHTAHSTQHKLLHCQNDGPGGIQAHPDVKDMRAKSLCNSHASQSCQGWLQGSQVCMSQLQAQCHP
jgi:hypothetical protein